MSDQTIELEGGRGSFVPGARARGRVRWRLAEAPASLELRLFWYTSGKGTEDVEIVARRELPAAASGESAFDLAIPEGPYSFSGKLITLAWAIELVAGGSEAAARTELLVSPSGEEVRLGLSASGQAV